MANIKSAEKRQRLAERRRLRNNIWKTRVKRSVRHFLENVSGDQAEATEAFREASRIIDKAVSKGVYHRNFAARKKSRMARKLNQAAAQ